MGKKKSRTPSDEYIQRITMEAAKAAQEMLYDAEDRMAITNIVIMLYAIKMTPELWKLKTVQKSLQKILEHYNEASEHVDKMGLKRAYTKLCEEDDVELVFDDFDLKSMFDAEQIKIRIQLPQK